MDLDQREEISGMAARALMELIAAGKVSAGDLIKLLSLSGREQEEKGQDFIIRVTDE